MSLERLVARGDAIGTARVETVRRQVAAIAAQAVPAAEVSVEGRDVIVTGRGVIRVLGWIGSLLR